MPLTAVATAILRSDVLAEQILENCRWYFWCKVNDSIGKNDYYKDEIIFK